MSNIDENLTIPFHQFLGFEVVSSGGGYGEIRMPITDNVRNSSGAVHGGIYYALCDICCTLAFLTVLPENDFCVTHDINSSVMAAAFDGDLIAKAQVLKAGKRLGFIECKITDSKNQLVAVGRVTKTILPKSSTGSSQRDDEM